MTPSTIVFELLLLAAIAAVVLVHRDRAGGERCRGCGYDLTVRPSGGCPECGVDLGAVVPVMAGAAAPMGTARRSVLLGLILLAIGLAASPLTGRLVPRATMYSAALQLEVPESAAYTSVSIDSYLISPGALPLGSPDTVQLSLIDLAGIPHDLEIDGRTMVATYTDSDGRTMTWPVGETGGRSATAMSAWFAAVGVVADDANRLQLETIRLAAHLHQKNEWFQPLAGVGAVPERITPLWATQTGTSSTAAAADPWRLVLLNGPWIAAWLAGTGLFAIAAARRRRRYAALTVTRVAIAAQRLMHAFLGRAWQRARLAT